MTHLFAKIEITKANNSRLLRVTIPCIRGSLTGLQNFFKLSLAKNFEVSKGYFVSSYGERMNSCRSVVPLTE